MIAGLGSLFSLPFLIGFAFASKNDLQISRLLNELRKPFLQVLITRSILGSGLIVAGFTMTTAIKSVLLLRLEPVFVFVFSVLYLHEKPVPSKLIALAMLVIGSLLVVEAHNAIDGPNLGDGLIVLSLLFLSFSYIPTKEIVEKSSPAGLNILTNGIGGAVLTLIAFCIPNQSVDLTPKALGLVAGYTLSFSVIGASLYYYAFKSLKAWVIASFLSLEVVFGSILAFVLLKESMSPIQMLGALIVLGATVAISYLERKKSKTTQD